MDQDKFDRLKRIADGILREEEEALQKCENQVRVATMNLKSLGPLHKLIGAKEEKESLDRALKERELQHQFVEKVRKNRSHIDTRRKVFSELEGF